MNGGRTHRWQITLGLILLFLSGAVYFIHYLIFRDAHHIFIYMLGDIAFVFVEVLLVTLIIHRLLMLRERRAMLLKLNMVIGAFFSEAGTPLLKKFSAFDPHVERIRSQLALTFQWTEREFEAVSRGLDAHGYEVDIRVGDLAGLKLFLEEQRKFVVQLLQNSNLLEHETFTDLLWAVLHLTEELSHRVDTGALPDADLAHLAGDIKRAYMLLMAEWLAYLRHLMVRYPYLFSLAVRTNPFNPSASAVIRG